MGGRQRWGRRELLGGAAAWAATACAASSTPAPLQDKPTEAPTPAAIPEPSAAASSLAGFPLSLVDFHTHLQKRISAEELIVHMDGAGVSRMFLMPLYYGDAGGAVNDGEGTDEQALEYARRFPTRFVAYVGMQRDLLLRQERWQTPDQVAFRFLSEVEGKLRSGAFLGMGEFMLRFYPYTTSLGINAVSDMDFPPDSRLMRLFAELAATYKVPMVIHCEAEPAAAAAMTHLIQGQPDAKFIWAHNCGRSSAQQIGVLLSTHSNLYADLSAMMYTGGEGYGSYWPRRTPWMHLIADESGKLVPAMRALFDAFPNRFLLGTDTAHARVYANYRQLAGRWRVFLPQLSQVTRRQIAFENAERLLVTP